MKILLKILNIFFLILGVIFFCLILIGAYMWIADPLELRSEDTSVGSIIEAGLQGGVEEDNVDKHPLLDEEQEARLETFGIDPAALPSEITPEMDACATEKLGAERMAQIKAGDEPTAADYFKARSCM